MSRRAYQCPGCWAFSLHVPPPEGAYLECECGEGLCGIDLRGPRQELPPPKEQHGAIVRTAEVAYVGACSCGWESNTLRPTHERALADVSDHQHDLGRLAGA